MYGVEALDLARVFEAYRSISFKKKKQKEPPSLFDVPCLNENGVL